ncbi:c-type cytochrome [Candidatus Ponderosibacter sp. Uisw_141_02]|uniref:c-type cytochrome n=1 Tax=Candidatus Ponderosibacter sp. Uisw_141_02 TaxID=3231000 RepID=UPI003D410EBC
MKASIFVFNTVLGCVFASNVAIAGVVELRPNDPVYVKLGKNIYVDQCASCHGVNLEGQEGWRDKMVDGMRLAPPMIAQGIHGIILMNCCLTLLNMGLKQ